MDLVLGVVRWAALAVERVARSKALRWRVSHQREAVPLPLGSTLKKEECYMLVERERETARPGESGKVCTMTQGHGAHGDGGGMAKLLIAACGISYRHHRADSALTPAPTYPTPTVTHSGKNKKRRRRRRIEISSAAAAQFAFSGMSFRVINLWLNCVSLRSGRYLIVQKHLYLAVGGSALVSTLDFVSSEFLLFPRCVLTGSKSLQVRLLLL